MTVLGFLLEYCCSASVCDRIRSQIFIFCLDDHTWILLTDNIVSDKYIVYPTAKIC